MKEISIPFAIDTKTNNKVFADELLEKSIEVRRLMEYRCYYCNKPLLSVVNKNNPNIQSWFRHKNKESHCILQNYSKQDQNLDFKYIKNTESERHKELKLALRKWLYKQGVQKVEEEKIIFNNNFFYRRPDVYCEFIGKKIAFEIQVSKLSYKSLKTRSDFFKTNGIYCIWIVDWFQPYATQGDHDFIEHNPYENVFTIDLSSDLKKFLCVHYEQYILDTIIKTERKKKFINSLDKLIFDDNSYQVYFYNTPLNRNKIIEQYNKKRESEEIKNKKNIEVQNRKKREEKIAQEYIKKISFLDIDDEIEFISNLKKDFLNFLPETKNFFFEKIKKISYENRYEYDKPFLNNLIFHGYGNIVKFLLLETNNLFVDGLDESGLTIWHQLVGCCYGFNGESYSINVDTLVPLINKHTNKRYTIKEVELFMDNQNLFK